MAAESVSYAVIHKAYTTLSNGTNQTYSLSYTAHANVCGFRRTNDSMLNHAAKLKGLGVQHPFTAQPVKTDLTLM